MTPIPGYMAWCLAGLLLCAALLLLHRPAARLLRLTLRSSVGLAVLAAPINQLLFHSGDHTEAVRMLAGQYDRWQNCVERFVSRVHVEQNNQKLAEQIRSRLEEQKR